MDMLGLSPPKPPKTVPMPDEESVRRAKLREQQKASQRSGRQSTILGGAAGETLG